MSCCCFHRNIMNFVKHCLWLMLSSLGLLVKSANVRHEFLVCVKTHCVSDVCVYLSEHKFMLTPCEKWRSTCDRSPRMLIPNVNRFSFIFMSLIVWEIYFQVSNYKFQMIWSQLQRNHRPSISPYVLCLVCFEWFTELLKNKIQTFCNFNLKKSDLLVSISKPALTKHPTHTVWLTGDFCEDLTDIRSCGTRRFDELMIERGRQWGRGGERGVENRRSRGEGVCAVWERGVERAHDSRQATSSSSLSQSDTWENTVRTSETDGV